MFPVDAGSSVRYTPPATPPPPPPHVVKPQETVATVAKTYQVTPEELARTNHITVDTQLTPGQQLQLPPNAVQPAQTDAAPATPVTPAAKTDAAIKTYQQAVQDRTDATRNMPQNGALRQEIRQGADDAVNKAKTAMDQAIHDEIAGEVALRNQGVPGQFRTPTDQLVANASDAILARHQGDAGATPLIKDAVHGYQVQAKADALIPGYYGDWSAADKLKGINLQGQPKEVVDAVLADPRVKQWVADAAHDATGKSAADCAKYLADLTRQSPDLGRAVTTQWWNAQDDASWMSGNSEVLSAMSDPQVYRDLSVVYRNLGGSDAGQAMQRDFAGDVAKYLEKNSMLANRTDVLQAISDGGDPALALAVASNLQADGKSDLAMQMVSSVKLGMGNLQRNTLKQDMQDYAKQTEELNNLIKDLGPGLTADQKQQAIQKYIEGKGKDWQDQLKAHKDKLVADVRALDLDITSLTDVPDNLKSYGLTKEGAAKLLDDDTTKQSIEFAATQDPSVFDGPEGGEAAKLLIELGHKDKDFTAAVGKAYVVSHLMPSLGEMNPSDDASIAKVKQALESFRGVGAQMLGIPQDEVDKGINKLEEVVNSLRTETLADAKQGKAVNEFASVQKELKELKELPFSDAKAGMLFRTMALGITGAAFISQTGKTIEDPTVQNVIGSLAFGLDLAPAKNALTGTIQALDKNNVLEQWGHAAPELTEKFIGVLNVAYFAAGAVQGVADHDYPTAIFSGVGAGGAALAAFGGEEMLGGFAGPIGIAVATIAVVALHFIEQHHKEQEYQEAQNKFLEGAGIENKDEREALIGAGPDQLNAMRARGITPENIQEIAETDPRLLHIAYGTDGQGRPY
ncbi:LysM peptidoglycan-binding domain-containing protein [Dyella sp. 2RAB6]|uniref:LysM peptidoglycan-binding domain-containing protein n=1 Tax=Dyella sp. 2RAB6 TaxID=3232992 RepID=UPI003F9177BD